MMKRNKMLLLEFCNSIDITAEKDVDAFMSFVEKSDVEVDEHARGVDMFPRLTVQMLEKGLQQKMRTIAYRKVVKVFSTPERQKLEITQKFEALFNKWDQDGSGTLEKEE